MYEKPDYFYKIVLLGDYDAGKTNFIYRYFDMNYNFRELKTIGLDYKIKRITLDNGKKVKLQIWDTPSSERFDSITKISFTRANGFIIMYNITKQRSFERAKGWLREIRDYSDNNNIAFVGNHADIGNSNLYYDRREISTEEGQKFAEDNNLLFFEASNITKININECFNALINRIYENDPKRNRNENKDNFKLGQNRPAKRGCLK